MKYLLLVLLLLVSTSAEARHHYHHRHHRHHIGSVAAFKKASLSSVEVIPVPKPRPVVTTVFDTGYYSFRNFTDWECLLPSQFRMWDNPIPVPTMVVGSVAAVTVVKPLYKAQSLTYNGMSVKGSYILLAGAVMLLLGAVYPTDWWPFSSQTIRDRSRTHTYTGAVWHKFYALKSPMIVVTTEKSGLWLYRWRRIRLISCWVLKHYILRHLVSASSWMRNPHKKPA